MKATVAATALEKAVMMPYQPKHIACFILSYMLRV
jgi:hypothetical protein